MDPVILVFIILLATILISRFVLVKGLSLLNENEQSKVVSVFSNYRIWNFVALIGFAAIYFLIIKFQSQNYLMLAYIYLGIVVAALYLSTNQSVQKFKSNKFNPAFIRYFIASNVIRGVGIAVFFMVIMLSLIHI